ncbi:FAD-binding oxidoreductase [Sporosarcina pasteurii]|uniref:Glycine oxidase n=1 Tax=Sporosarcina pasteurii TaxID=1474 RepID=A0A380BI73_SPOPA|nr:FAD-dependent oxidoreductase [Sporosarcina pasteurii]MDS9470764.1 FAD-dependent oxidoreductase [Sporosarcina pasteurii]QBQ05564.1 FAD-binding oxidoreductase [Sporosarcina pasteurii]SUJ01931.1 Glycine oxidase [Sporosarcina pasteurii]
MNKFIVIGAGILGASTAYHLAKLGASVTVIDRKDQGQATDAAAGIICPWLSQRRNKAWYALAKNGAAYYETLIEALEADGEKDTGYRKVGAISLHTENAKLEAMEERATTRRMDAPEIGEVYRLNEDDTNQLFPPLDEAYASVYVSGAARVNGRAVRDALINGAKKHGATFIEGSASLIHQDTDIVGVKVGEQVIHADRVIVTAGAWASDLLSPIGIDLQVRGQKAQIAHLQLEGVERAHMPVVMPPTNQYILTFDDGEVVVGATYEDDKEGDLNVTAGGLHEILNKALQVAPGLNSATYKEARVGFRPVTPNFMPIIGEVPNMTGLFLANGLGSSGLTVGPYLGGQLAKLALGQQVEIDLDLYRVDLAMTQNKKLMQ